MLLSCSFLLDVGLGPARPAAADPISGCSVSAGVLVVVDFGHWSQPVEIGCAPASGSGYTAMSAAGFITAGTEEDGPAFVCRIGLAAEGSSSFEPTPAQDPCVNTPPLTAYWSYWHAAAGQNTWSYSPQGFMSYRPPAGSIDAWTFGSSNVAGTAGQPAFSPDQVRAAAQSGGSGSFVAAPAGPSTTAATSSPTGADSGPATTRPTAVDTGSAPGRAAAAPPAPTTPPPKGDAQGAAGPAGVTTTEPVAESVARPATATTTPLRWGPPTTQIGTSDPARVGPAGGSGPPFRIVASSGRVGRSRSGSSGPPATFVAGLVVVAGLAGLAGVVAWHRRRSAG
jgi:hypothetical protein